MKGESFLALLAGMATGAVLGILFAPEKGEVTRANLKRKASDKFEDLKECGLELRDKASSKAQVLREEILELKDTLCEYGSELKDDVRAKFEQKISKLEAALARENEDEI